MPSAISTDVLIVGAGVAGLWLNARLRRLGYSTVLVERASLAASRPSSLKASFTAVPSTPCKVPSPVLRKPSPTCRAAGAKP